MADNEIYLLIEKMKQKINETKDYNNRFCKIENNLNKLLFYKNFIEKLYLIYNFFKLVFFLGTLIGLIVLAGYVAIYTK